MKEFELQVRIRNNRLKERRLALGLNQDKMNEVIGLKGDVYHEFEMLKRSPYDLEGGFTPEALMVAEYFDVDPGELFPPSVKAVTSSTTTRALDGSEIEALMSVHTLASVKGPETLFLEEENARVLFQSVRASSERSLNDFERSVLRKHFGIGKDTTMSYEEIGKDAGLSRYQVGQVVEASLCRLRKGVIRRLEKLEKVGKPVRKRRRKS